MGRGGNMKQLAWAVAVLGLGCSATFDETGVLYISFDADPANDMPDACMTSVEHNVTDFEYSEATSDWMITRSDEHSPSVGFAQLFEGEGDRVILVIGEDVFEGSQDGDAITVSRARSESETFTASLDAAEYEFLFTRDDEVVDTLTLNRGDDGWSGNWRIQSTFANSYSESDRFAESVEDPDCEVEYTTYYTQSGGTQTDTVPCDTIDFDGAGPDIGYFGLTFEDAANATLDHVMDRDRLFRNIGEDPDPDDDEPLGDDCDASGPCELATTTECTFRWSIDVVEVDVEDEAFDGVFDAGHDEGLF